MYHSFWDILYIVTFQLDTIFSLMLFARCKYPRLSSFESSIAFNEENIRPFKKRNMKVIDWRWIWNSCVLIKYTAKLLFEVRQSSYVVASWYLQIWQREYHIAGQKRATHNEVPMVYHQLLACREVNFVVQLKVVPWWLKIIRSVAFCLIRIPHYGIAV